MAWRAVRRSPGLGRSGARGAFLQVAALRRSCHAAGAFAVGENLGRRGPRRRAAGGGAEELFADFAIPCVQAGAHRRDAFGLGGGEVALLSDIGAEIVKGHGAVLIIFDQFPIADADCAAGKAVLIAVMRVVPVEGFARGGRAAAQ